MDLHRRLMVRAPIPRPFGERGDIAQFRSRGDSLRVSHPPPPRPEPQTTSGNLVEDRPKEDLALVPYRATRTASIYFGHSSRASSSLSLQSSYRDSSYYADASSSSSVSARFRDSVSSSLAAPVLGGPGGRSTADLLRDWKNDLNEKKIAPLPSATTPQSPVSLGPNRARQSQHMMRQSSAPSTPSFSQRSFSPIYETQPPSPAMSRPGLRYNRDGMVSGESHHSDSYVPSVMSTPRMASVSPTVYIEGGFTHNLPSNSAKASLDEFFPDVP